MKLQPFITIDREEHLLTLVTPSLLGPRAYQFLVAVGKPGHDTPVGTFPVLAKSARPDWKIPADPDYPAASWGSVIPFGEPGNPFAVGFISLGDGVGIHGTTFPPQVGKSASHGCVRMRKKDIARIYDKVAIGTPVHIF